MYFIVSHSANYFQILPDSQPIQLHALSLKTKTKQKPKPRKPPPKSQNKTKQKAHQKTKTKQSMGFGLVWPTIPGHRITWCVADIPSDTSKRISLCHGLSIANRILVRGVPLWSAQAGQNLTVKSPTDTKRDLHWNEETRNAGVAVTLPQNLPSPNESAFNIKGWSLTLQTPHSPQCTEVWTSPWAQTRLNTFNHYLALSAYNLRRRAGPVQCPQASPNLPKVMLHTPKGRAGGRESLFQVPNAVSSSTGFSHGQHPCDWEQNTQPFHHHTKFPSLSSPFQGNHGLLLSLISSLIRTSNGAGVERFSGPWKAQVSIHSRVNK